MDDWACSFPFQRLVVSSNGIILPCTGATNEEENMVLGRYNGTPEKKVKGIDGKDSKIDISEIKIFILSISDPIFLRSKALSFSPIELDCNKPGLQPRP